ncbi:cutinase gene palindrome-binding protein [Plectosphaerella plurivora]|uniref:Cutinase gene palindrome-binding protein n=1 Tax=Plectosphaerella plurivora TaxID=936078 RepID=A0A9P9AG20_9PEZI|nr:cutinase gene palindrome-binding protein [Plectosphaerella plurivora]
MDDREMAAMFDNVMFGNYDAAMSLDDDEPATPGIAGQPNTIANNNNISSNDGALVLQTNRQSFDGGPDDIESPNPSTVGGGPMPAAGFGSQTSAPAGNTLTEFTKRRNWPAKVVEELRDFLKILDANGRIRFVSPSILQLTGYTNDEIVDNFLKDFIHADDVGVFVAELNESIASGNPLRMFYRFRKKDNTYAIFETVGHAHIAAAKFAPNPHNQSPFCQAVFMMARPYPTKNAALLDSFLEHKMENERLRRRIAELRREEEADNEESHKQWLSQSGRSDVTPSESMGPPSTMPDHPGLSRRQSDLPSATPQQQSHTSQPQQQQDASAALTREALEGASHSRPDSLKEKMARYEGSHTERIEMLTGLRFAEGERSKGITTGNASPSLVKGDAGIAIPIDRDPRTGDKKKKLKTSEEYVCTDCGTLDSPEWRKGPSGPKTLCNACGLRWAKKEKKSKPGSGPATKHTE